MYANNSEELVGDRVNTKNCKRAKGKNDESSLAVRILVGSLGVTIGAVKNSPKCGTLGMVPANPPIQESRSALHMKEETTK